MAFNITGFDKDIFFTINIAVGTSLFFTIVLTPLVLCILCVLALIFAGIVNKKLKLLLINIFAAEICTWLLWTLVFLGFPLRFHTRDGFNWICGLEISIFHVGGFQKYTSSALYAVMVYIFIKHGEKRLKWCVIISCIAVSWVGMTMTMGIFPYIRNFGTFNSSGFCAGNSDAIVFRTAVLFAVLITVICSGIVVVCCVLTGVYIKRNTLEGNVEVKKAVAKVLVYLTIVTVLSFITSMLPAATPEMRQTAGAHYGTIGEIVATFILRVIYCSNSIPTPVVAIIFLKPVRIALKEIGKVIILCDCIRKRPNAAGVNIEVTA